MVNINDHLLRVRGVLVATNRCVLCEYGLDDSAKTAAAQLSENIPRHDHRVSYSLGAYSYHCQVENQIVYIAVTDGSGQQRVRMTYSFLGDVSQRFRAAFSQQDQQQQHQQHWQRPPASTTPDVGYPQIESLTPARCAPFSATLATCIRNAQQNSTSYDLIGKVNAQINGVREVMIENIEQVVARGEHINDTVDKTARLEDECQIFHDEARQLHKAVWWKNKRQCFCIACFILILIGLLAAATLLTVCKGTDLSKCHLSKDQQEGGDKRNASE